MEINRIQINTQKELPLTNTELKVILNEIITPKMIELGLRKYDDGYLWFSDFNEEGIKKVFHYNLIKGATGSFSYGNCFSFIPTYSNSARISNHKTDKSTKLHLFEKTEGWRRSFEGQKFTDKTSHWGESTCRKTISELLDKYVPIMKSWWENNSTIRQNIETSNYQINHGGGYRVNHPQPSYIKAFLIAKVGEIESAINIIDNEFSDLIQYNSKFQNVKNKLSQQLRTY